MVWANHIHQNERNFVWQLCFVTLFFLTPAITIYCSTDIVLAQSPASARNAFYFDLKAAAAKAHNTVSSDRAKAIDAVWEKCWIPFLQELNIEGDPYLTHVADKVPILRVFAIPLRDGRLSQSKQPIRAPHVWDEILYVAKMFTELGLPDPRMNTHRDMDPRRSSLYKSFSNEDPAPNRVKPLPIQVLHHAQALANQSTNQCSG